MKVMVALAVVLLSACTTSSPLEFRRVQHEVVRPVRAPQLMQSPGVRSAAYPADTISLLDSRAIRALRQANRDPAALSLTEEQKVAMWVGIGLVVAYLISEWIEDEVAFFPE